MKHGLRRVAPRLPVFVLIAVLGACGTPRAPVDSRGDSAKPVPAMTRPTAPTEPRRADGISATHAVERGDTLYSISWRYGLDYRDVARWNGIAEPYVIHPGQRLRLTAPALAGAPPVAASVPRPAETPTAAPVTPVPGAPRAATPIPQVAVPESGPIRWQWPVRGRIVRSDSPTSKKGLDIAGTRSQSISAAAAGAVVYSGSGLLGYGRLIILKHSDTFLSAYAYNEQLLVAEGDRVTAGQQIATMGTGTSGQPMLHFEIRRDGKPVNPLEYLPRSD